MKDTTQNILADNGLDSLDGLVVLPLVDEGGERYLKDLKINLKNVLSVETLSEKETSLLALAIAVNNGNNLLISTFAKLSEEKGASKEEIAEAASCASLLSANNVLYRFRHFMDDENYKTIPAKIKMNIMMSPVTGKGFFELMSLAVSAVNGCQACVSSHEASVRNHGYTREQVFDAIRLAAVVTSYSKIIN
jgi:lipoyl-dependent peroxiredoxin subunit D